jgi:hypothetical protein
MQLMYALTGNPAGRSDGLLLLGQGRSGSRDAVAQSSALLLRHAPHMRADSHTSGGVAGIHPASSPGSTGVAAAIHAVHDGTGVEATAPSMANYRPSRSSVGDFSRVKEYAFVCTDIEGSTSLSSQAGPRLFAALLVRVTGQARDCPD